MATSREFCDEILAGIGFSADELTVRPMMGEFLLYYRGVLVGGIYDGRLLIKETTGNQDKHLEQVIPYDSAKRTMYYVEDLDDKPKAQEIILTAYSELLSGKKAKGKNNQDVHKKVGARQLKHGRLRTIP